MLYVGEELNAISEWRGVEPALINPRLQVESAQPDRIGAGLNYWPSYSGIPAESRAAYLEWLASGRSQSNVPIGYVFLFLYGLERRLMVDATKSHAARAERDPLVAEIDRLLRLYGDNRSFRGYAGTLLDTVRVLSSDQRLYDSPPPTARCGYELPLSARMAMAQLVADGRPIPAEWAWTWLTLHPQVSLRTAAQRCVAEFRSLFLSRYAQKFGDGMVLKPNKSRLTITYRPASPSFGGALEFPVDQLPDVTSLEAPLQRLQALADTCAEDLDAYSRWLGRNPEGRGSLGATALLPHDLLDGVGADSITPLREWLHARAGDRDATLVPASEVLRFWPMDGEAKLRKPEAVSFAQLIEKLGYGLEPDVRFGGPALSADTSAVVFRLPSGSPAAPSASYGEATLLLHVGAAVAEADGSISSDEERQLEAHLEASLNLSAGERTRLRAHLGWLLAVKPGMNGLKKRFGTLDETQRRLVGRHLVAVAGADGHFDPAEVTTLTKMYRLLGFTPAEAYSDIHTLASATTLPATEPVTVQVADQRATGFAIPVPPTAPATGPVAAVQLDAGRIAATLAETKVVSSLLAGIFTDDEPAPARQPSTVPGVAGLDAAHSALVRAVTERHRWTRTEVEDLCQRYGLLLEGALDTINEAALDRCGDPLCDGEDPMDVNPDVAKELLA
jgi:uncharacterized tellurite resistance protein B-like protein